eukprot:377348-Pleurochrysis_carterae.AAC.2
MALPASGRASEKFSLPTIPPGRAWTVRTGAGDSIGSTRPVGLKGPDTSTPPPRTHQDPLTQPIGKGAPVASGHGATPTLLGEGSQFVSNVPGIEVCVVMLQGLQFTSLCPK